MPRAGAKLRAGHLVRKQAAELQLVVSGRDSCVGGTGLTTAPSSAKFQDTPSQSINSQLCR
jgi:hypothetical protein